MTCVCHDIFTAWSEQLTENNRYIGIVLNVLKSGIWFFTSHYHYLLSLLLVQCCIGGGGAGCPPLQEVEEGQESSQLLEHNTAPAEPNLSATIVEYLLPSTHSRYLLLSTHSSEILTF